MGLDSSGLDSRAYTTIWLTIKANQAVCLNLTYFEVACRMLEGVLDYLETFQYFQAIFTTGGQFYDLDIM